MTRKRQSKVGNKTLCTRIVSLFVLITLFGAAVTILAISKPAFAGTDTYPTSIAGCRLVSNPGGGSLTCDLKDATQDKYIDPWGEYNRECTSYAAWMLHAVNRFEMPFHDNANNWGTRARNLGYTVNMTPAVGSIYWAASHLGHVAWVESVSSDGKTITIEDYNSDYTGHYAEHIGVATSSASGYIHFKDVNVTPPPPTSPVPWNFETLDGDPGSVSGYNANVGQNPRSIIYNNGLQMFYYDRQHGTLRHAWNYNAGWHFENLDGGNLGANSGSTDAIGQNPSVVLYSSTLQLFSYNASKGDLRHDWSDANGWHFENLDGQGSAGPDQYNLGLYSTTVANGTTLQLFYYDSQWGELRHAFSDANGWHFENLDGLGGLPAGRLGPNMSIGLYPNTVIFNNVPQVFYYDATNGNLRHTWAQ